MGKDWVDHPATYGMNISPFSGASMFFTTTFDPITKYYEADDVDLRFIQNSQLRKALENRLNGEAEILAHLKK